MKLRDYQGAAKRAAYADLRIHPSVLLVLATGTGKTVIFADVCADAIKMGRRVLVLAHRNELIEQAASKIEAAIGQPVGREGGKRRDATRPAPMAPRGAVIVSSTQTMVRRYAEIPADYFDLIILDEAHHALAKGNMAIFDHFASAERKAKRLGVTATPERGDKKSLGAAFASISYEFDMLAAMRAGWLVPLRVSTIDLPGLDLSLVGRRAGDLDAEKVGELMSTLDMLASASRAIVNALSGRQCLVFCASVRHAHTQAESLREVLAEHGLEHVRVEALDGSAKQTRRDEVVADYCAGKIAILCGCDLFTEGFDAPPTSLVVMLRPTSLRGLYCQMLGRGTRPLPGVVDGPPTPEARLAAIAASAKPDLLVLDIAGNAGRHDLVSAIDMLVDVTEQESEEVRASLAAGSVDDLLAALEAVRARRRKIDRAKRARDGDFFAMFDLDRRVDPWGRDRPISSAQAAMLDKRKISPVGLDHTAAMQIIEVCHERARAGLCTYGQARVLVRAGVPLDWLPILKLGQAMEMITVLVNSNYRPPADWWRAFAEQDGDPRAVAGAG